MGLGPYTAQRAHEFTRLAVASGVKILTRTCMWEIAVRAV